MTGHQDTLLLEEEEGMEAGDKVGMREMEPSPPLSTYLPLPLVQAETARAAVVKGPEGEGSGEREEEQAGPQLSGLARLRQKTPKTSIPRGLPGSSPRPLKRSVCLVSLSLSRARSLCLSRSSLHMGLAWRWDEAYG